MKKCAGCGGKRRVLSQDVLNQTRVSCLKCVEKHLGQACVLLCEVYDGYPFRLGAVGHLGEAEAESQEWAELHNLIRSSREAYQSQNTMPDWLELQKIIMSLRQILVDTKNPNDSPL